MPNSTTRQASGGLGLAGVVLVVFIILKLTGLVGWPWLWVLAPLWIGAGLWLLVLIVGAVVLVVKR